MDNNAIKAYASVIADAAEDSEPATPVVYAAVDVDSGSSDQRMKKAPMWINIQVYLMINI